MKTSTLLVLLVMLCSFSNIKSNNSLEEGNIKGKVKSITYYSFSDSTNTIASKIVYQYDKWGNEIAESSYLENGDLDTVFNTTWQYKYDSNNLRVESNLYGSDGLLSWKTTYAYDKNGNLIETNRYHENGLLEERCIYEYDSSGNETEERSYDRESDLNDITTFEYKEGNLVNRIEDWSSTSPQTLLQSAKFAKKYNKQGTSEFVEYNLDNDILIDAKVTNPQYDDTGNMIKWTEVTYDRGRTYSLSFAREITYY